MGKGRKLGHVADALGKGDGGCPASKQARKPLRGLKARVVRVEGEEDPGAAPQALRHLLDPLGAQGSDAGDAPLRKGKPVEDALGHHREGRRGAETPKPKHRLGAGKRLEPGRPVGVYGPPDKPADKTAGGVGNDHHPCEPLTALGEQPAVPEPSGIEAVRHKGLPQPAPRRVAEAETQGGVKSDAPRGQVLPCRRAAPELPGVEPDRRRQQGRVPWGQRDCPGTPGRNRTRGCPGSKPWAAVQPPDRIGQAQVLDPLDEVQHVAAQAAAEAVPPLTIAVHREAALGLVVEGTDALADPAPSPESDARRLNRVAQGVTGLQRRDVNGSVGYDHHAPPLRGRRPRRLRRETALPGSQRIPRTAATSSEPSSLGTRAAARPAPWL